MKNSYVKPVEISHSEINRSDINTSDIKRSEIKRPREEPNSSEQDWNLAFLKNPTEKTIYDFEQTAVSALMAIWTKDMDALHDPRRVYESKGLRVAISNCFTKEAQQLKR